VVLAAEGVVRAARMTTAICDACGAELMDCGTAGVNCPNNDCPDNVRIMRQLRDIFDRKKEMTMADEKVNHPAHYGGATDPYEAIKVIEAWGLDFNLGNCLKYLCRAYRKMKTKAGELEDLEKARWYLEREIATLKEAIDGAQRDPEVPHRIEHHFGASVVNGPNAGRRLCMIAGCGVYQDGEPPRPPREFTLRWWEDVGANGWVLVGDERTRRAARGMKDQSIVVREVI
jgi:hypothetical protein